MSLFVSAFFDSTKCRSQNDKLNIQRENNNIDDNNYNTNNKFDYDNTNNY